MSGEKQGVISIALRGVLVLLSWCYRVAVGLRNFLYDKNYIKTQRLDAAVISVGNITVGGTGKTPLVIRLCNFLRSQGRSCAILTRGYKAKGGAHSDEPAMLNSGCEGASVIVNSDRVTGAFEAIERFRCDVLIMDDGFQHRRLHRDLDIVTIDATRAFGYGRLLPAGLLREPVASLRRAQGIVITRCDQQSRSGLDRIEEALRTVNPSVVIARTIHKALYIKIFEGKEGQVISRGKAGSELNISELRDKNVFAFCGIGNPKSFFNSLSILSANLKGTAIYNDHHQYNQKDLDEIYEDAASQKADLIVTTEKDFRRLEYMRFPSGGLGVCYIGMEVEFLSGAEQLKELIKYSLRCKIR